MGKEKKDLPNCEICPESSACALGEREVCYCKKVIPTKLKDVFNLGNNLSFDVDTPQFTKEACENCTGGIYAVCWNIFRCLLGQVAERATELNDPVLNALMIRLQLYDVPKKKRYYYIKKMKKQYDGEK